MNPCSIPWFTSFQVDSIPLYGLKLLFCIFQKVWFYQILLIIHSISSYLINQHDWQSNALCRLQNIPEGQEERFWCLFEGKMRGFGVWLRGKREAFNYEKIIFIYFCLLMYFAVPLCVNYCHERCHMTEKYLKSCWICVRSSLLCWVTGRATVTDCCVST
jgi:hypothetical protein